MERVFQYDVLPQIKTRWSPRALSSDSIPREDLLPLIEAARYAPSCFNEQPWYFVIADTPDILNPLRETLTPGNKLWAIKAPVLILVCARKKFSGKDAANFWSQFDAGTSWGYLSLEAERRGLCTHGMGGFDREAAHKAAGLPDSIEAIALVAVGRPGNKEDLPAELRERELPGTRNDIADICVFGKYQ
jgi:nitroreductase